MTCASGGDSFSQKKFEVWSGRGKGLIEGLFEGDIDILYGHWQAQIYQRCNAVFHDSARDDAVEMAEVRVNIDREAVEADPFAQADADGGDLVFGFGAGGHNRFVVTGDPDANATWADVSGDIELIECRDHPSFELFYKRAHILAAFANVEHHINHPLARSVIGVLPATFGFKNVKAAGVGQIGGFGGGSGRVKGGVFEQPYGFGRGAICDSGGARFHCGFGLSVADKPVAYMPLHSLLSGLQRIG